ncbi:LysM peptidoglycan-binding domain-containing protein [Microbacterium sp. 179-I 3D4 NHS]|uniref:LysM peptidoglycan-binding domain-containing protein n=1 Tax=Microbacterium sp. 179-I 3D4 NHS TaxID=3142381 RepID=UPI0039A1B555
MSTITFGTAAVVPARPTRLRLTPRGRRVLLALAAVPLAGGIAFAALSGGSALASGESAASVTFETVTVLPGDTLWSIAETVAPEADPREVIGEITRLNVLEGGTLQIGQELSIPTEFSH